MITTINNNNIYHKHSMNQWRLSPIFALILSIQILRWHFARIYLLCVEYRLTHDWIKDKRELAKICKYIWLISWNHALWSLDGIRQFNISVLLFSIVIVILIPAYYFNILVFSLRKSRFRILLMKLFIYSVFYIHTLIKIWDQYFGSNSDLKNLTTDKWAVMRYLHATKKIWTILYQKCSS